ncbi:hypothetical protein K5549_020486, partial [Capra hircus]|uniref:Uncharacterized protein n=1 Tax=Capra hircus TaxID=9925 RepID=A0A452E332_CAPHI
VGKVDGITQEAVQAAINPRLDQVNTCLDHLEERNDHLPGRLQDWQTHLEFQQPLREAPSDWHSLQTTQYHM